jgi:hypothetical protein
MRDAGKLFRDPRRNSVVMMTDTTPIMLVSFYGAQDVPTGLELVTDTLIHLRAQGMPYIVVGDFNTSVAQIRDHLYAHAAREVVLSFGLTCHSKDSASDIDMAIVSMDALPLVTRYWKASSVLKAHDPLVICIQTKPDHFRCTAWVKPCF